MTLSEEQLKVARERAEDAGVADQVKFELIDYRHVEEQFDRIVSIGMFEHVGAAHYDEFFAKCRELLKPDGVMLLHTIGKLGKPSGARPVHRQIYLPRLPPAVAFADGRGQREGAADRHATSRLFGCITPTRCATGWSGHRKAKAKIVALYDERFFRMWEFYLAGGIVAFETGSMCNYQMQYVRDRNALPITRDYMAEAEERYRKLGAAPAQKAAAAQESDGSRTGEMKRPGGERRRAFACHSDRPSRGAASRIRWRICRRSSGVICPSRLASAMSKCRSAAACASCSVTRPSLLASAISNMWPPRLCPCRHRWNRPPSRPPVAVAIARGDALLALRCLRHPTRRG